MWSVAILLLLASAIAHAQITPSADAYTSSTAPTTNYGSATTLGVDGVTQTTYIQFNLSSIPSGTSISQATLKLYVNGVTTAGSFNVDYVNGSWSESKITHNLAPALGSTIVSGVALTTASKNQYILVDITSAVQAWLSGSEANDGIALVANSTFNATFDSKENITTSHPPELDIAFAGTITGVTTASGSGLQGGGTSGTLNMGLTTSCTSGQTLVWNGSTWACQTPKGSGTVTSVGLSAPSSDFKVTGSPVTGSGTLGLNWTVAPTSADTANTIVKRDSTGSFSVTNITSGGQVTVSSPAAGAYAIFGSASGTSNTEYGVLGSSASVAAGSSGMFGKDASSGGNKFTTGVTGLSENGTGGIGVLGYGSTFSNLALQDLGATTAGVWGDGPQVGVLGTSDKGTGLSGVSTDGTGVYGSSQSSEGVSGTSTNGTGVSGYSLTVFGVSGNSPNGNGVIAFNDPSGSPTDLNATLVAINESTASQYVLYTENSSGSTYVRTDSGYGDLVATGTISGGAQASRIDHPLDPTGKYLLHADIESPEMKNLYDGVVQLDSRGEATVQLPDYFEALNRDFRYQLTSIAAPGPNLFIAQEVSGNQFRIAGGQPGAKVSWQVTGIRHDAWANANPLQVEIPKTGKEVGHYVHPHAFGQPDSMSTDYHEPRKVPTMRQGKEQAELGSGRTHPLPGARR